ncbi:MAG: diguanylate cyclase [Castellaniella sp.]|uniref:GGDEF domain-containing protein n=1 Tax=Castellaniella sp. TaxID=1955812 RepID=UPI003C765D80
MHRTISSSLSSTRQVWRFILVAALASLLIHLSLVFRPALGEIGFWPATALLAGVLLRMPRSQDLPTWLMVLAGTILAYGNWYGSLQAALMHTVVDLSGVCATWYLLGRIWHLETLRTPQAIARVLVAGLAGAFCTALAGLIAQIRTDAQLQIAIEVFFRQWLGYSAILPVCLQAALSRRPATDKRGRAWAHLPHHLKIGSRHWPLLSLLAAVSLAALLGGPGAVAFPIPALLFCAYAYQQQTTTWLTLASVLTLVLCHAHGLVVIEPLSPTLWTQVSLQMGLQLMVATPLLVSSSLAARNDLIMALNQALDHDELTEALSRQAFMRGAVEYLQQSPASFYGNGVMMLDIDHFKRLNDNHGHAAGDSVLREFSRITQSAIRPADLFGRLGGEEFGILLPNTTLQDSLDIAERLRACVEQIRLYYDSDEPLRVTVSIGVVHDSQAPGGALSTLLALADQAMYRAKHQGRNQVYSPAQEEIRDLSPVPQI